MNQAELVLDARAILGEGPSWDERKQVLYWVDVIGRKVHVYDPASNTDRVISTGQYVGSVVPCEDGGLLAAMQNGIYRLDPDSGRLDFVADPEEHLPGNRFNDGKCDAAGRFWAGTMDMSEQRFTGALYCLDRDGTVRKVLDSVGISNGMAWSRDNRTMYYIDTMRRSVAAFDFDIATASLANRRTVIDFTNERGVPDGMTIDEEGMLWIAHWDGYQVSRWDPRTGRKLDSIPLPVARVTSCVFGGPNRDELYITTARHNGIVGEYPDQPLAGGLFRVKFSGLKGAATCRYGAGPNG